MHSRQSKEVLTTLILISAFGVIAILFGSPKFVTEAIVIELSFITLSVLIWKGYTKALYACIALALTVIVGNSTSPAHIHCPVQGKAFNYYYLKYTSYFLFKLKDNQTNIIRISKKYLI